MIRIDSEFQTLIPPLADDEYKLLEKSILSEGVRESIITWHDTIIDGHNRYRICKEHGINCPSVEREFASRDDAKIWILGNQLGRRNLDPGQKAALAIERNEAEVREAARLRIGRPPKKIGSAEPHFLSTAEQPIQEQEKGSTTEILARKAGVSESTIKRVMKVKRENQELYEKVRSGEIPARTAYKQVIGEEKPKKHIAKQKLTDDGRRICSHCGKPINNGDCYKGREYIHKRCEDARRSQQQYKNPDISLMQNVADFSIESLFDELVSVAENLRDSWNESIEINESQGVKLSSDKKERLGKAVANLFETLNTIKEDN